MRQPARNSREAAELPLSAPDGGGGRSAVWTPASTCSTAPDGFTKAALRPGLRLPRCHLESRFAQQNQGMELPGHR